MHDTQSQEIRFFFCSIAGLTCCTRIIRKNSLSRSCPSLDVCDSARLNHSAPVFRPSVHSVTKPTSATHVTTPQKSLDHGCSVIVSPVHNISHPVELSGIQSSFSSSAAYSPSPSTYSASTSTHPHSKKKIIHSSSLQRCIIPHESLLFYCNVIKNTHGSIVRSY